MEEFIICAAILHDESGKVYFGHRHCHCFEASNGELSWTMNREQITKVKRTQGFVTSLKRFVNREEAMLIALKNNQVKTLLPNERPNKELYSEDLY